MDTRTMPVGKKVRTPTSNHRRTLKSQPPAWDWSRLQCRRDPVRELNISNVSGQAGGQAVESGGAIEGWQVDVEKTKALFPVRCLVEGAVQLLFGIDDKSAARADHIREAAVVERPYIVVGAVLHVA